MDAQSVTENGMVDSPAATSTIRIRHASSYHHTTGTILQDEKRVKRINASWISVAKLVSAGAPHKILPKTTDA